MIKENNKTTMGNKSSCNHKAKIENLEQQSSRQKTELKTLRSTNQLLESENGSLLERNVALNNRIQTMESEIIALEAQKVRIAKEVQDVVQLISKGQMEPTEEKGPNKK